MRSSQTVDVAPNPAVKQQSQWLVYGATAAIVAVLLLVFALIVGNQPETVRHRPAQAVERANDPAAVVRQESPRHFRHVVVHPVVSAPAAHASAPLPARRPVPMKLWQVTQDGNE